MTRYLTYVLAVIFNSTLLSASDLTFVDNGKSQFKIILPKSPSTEEKKAAKELSLYIQKSTGALLPISTIISGNRTNFIFLNPRASKKTEHLKKKITDDGYSIYITNKDIYIQGGEKNGILNGVYGFLNTFLGIEQLDAKYWHLPYKQKLILKPGTSILSNPAFHFRDVFNDIATNENYYHWYGLAHTFNNPENLGLFGHSFFKLVPPEKYFVSNPEYFSMIKGKRKAEQLCLSNDGMKSVLKRSLNEMMAKQPEKQYWMVGQEDMGAFCQCEKCVAGYKIYGGYSGLLIHMVNEVAAIFPKKTIATFAYHESLPPPTNSSVKPNKNVLVCYAPIEAFHDKPYKQLEEKQFSLDLIRWSKITDKLMVYDYTENFLDFLRPYPTIYTFKPNLLFFKSANVKYVFEESFIKTGGDLKELKTFLLSKLLWNPTLDDKKVIKQFCELYYGKAAPLIMEYLTASYTNMINENDKLRSWGGTSGYLQPKYLTQYDSILAKAAAAAGEDTLILSRVERIRINVDFCILKNKEATPNARTTDSSRKKRFINVAKKEGMTDFLSEGKWTLTENFIQSINN